MLADEPVVDTQMFVHQVCWFGIVPLAILLQDFWWETDLADAFVPDIVPGGTAAEAVPVSFVPVGSPSVVD